VSVGVGACGADVCSRTNHQMRPAQACCCHENQTCMLCYHVCACDAAAILEATRQGRVHTHTYTEVFGMHICGHACTRACALLGASADASGDSTRQRRACAPQFLPRGHLGGEHGRDRDADHEGAASSNACTHEANASVTEVASSRSHCEKISERLTHEQSEVLRKILGAADIAGVGLPPCANQARQCMSARSERGHGSVGAIWHTWPSPNMHDVQPSTAAAMYMGQSILLK
jgi:hypothetical protein